MSVFRYREDRWPVLLVVALTAIDIAVYFAVDSALWLVAYWLLMLVPKGAICAWNHHHQHVPTFRSTPMNRVLECCYALHTGLTTNAWMLHHVLGHHRNFLDQSRDESRWQGKDGQPMGVLKYTLVTALTAYPRAFRVGRQHPKHLRTFLVYSAVTFGLVAALVAYRPLPGFMVFAWPMVCSLLYTAWVTYDHHAGLDTEDQFQASNNILNPWYNRLTGNLGYHTAHHYRQGVHWSKLPELHAKIAHQIPASRYQRSTFDAWLPQPPGAVKGVDPATEG